MKIKNKIIMMLLVCASMCAISIPALAYDFGDAGITPYEYNTAMVLPLAVTPMSYEGACEATGSISNITVSGNNITFTATLSEDYVPYMFPVGHEYYSANGYYYLRFVPINNGVNGSAVPYFCNMVTELTDTFIGDFTTYDAYKIELYCYCEGSGVAYVDGHLLDKDYINALGHLCQPFNFLSKNEAGANHTYMHLFDTTLPTTSLTAEYMAFIESINHYSADYTYVEIGSSDFAAWLQYGRPLVDTISTVQLIFSPTVYDQYNVRLFYIEDNGVTRTIKGSVGQNAPVIYSIYENALLSEMEWDTTVYGNFAPTDLSCSYYYLPAFDKADYNNISYNWLLNSYTMNIGTYDDILNQFTNDECEEFTKLNDIDIATYFEDSKLPYTAGIFNVRQDYIPLIIYCNLAVAVEGSESIIPINITRVIGDVREEVVIYQSIDVLELFFTSECDFSSLSIINLRGLSNEFYMMDSNLTAPINADGVTYGFRYASILNSETYLTDESLNIEFIYEEGVANVDDFVTTIVDSITTWIDSTFESVGSGLETLGTIAIIALIIGAVLLLVFIRVIIVRFIRFIVRFGKKKNRRY